MMTGHKPRLSRCALARAIPDAFDAESAKEAAWRKFGILVVHDNDQRIDFLDRELIRRIGNFLYGGER